MIKACSLSLLALLMAGSVLAQDQIQKRNGTIVEGKVVEIGTKTISYKKLSNPDGPSYVIDKADVTKITYENGTTETINTRRPGPPMPPRPGRHTDDEVVEKPVNPCHYGNNIIAVSPMQLTDEGAGFGISYERVLDKENNYISFYLPVAIAVKRLDGSIPESDPTYYFMPGIKFYPTGGKGMVRYGLAANLVYAFGRQTYETFNNGFSQFVTDDFYKLGMIVNNSLNVNPTDHLHFGLEFGLGFPYVDESDNGFNNDGPLVQFGFKVGYRF
ncbi:hypothetical protein [Polluticoccus soli]|uniref:hypothetical protein n=1 Tax=Polluticoccus soli TaxID=3034150 RepID=UPI0023E0B373|nr:hypothetical protein [Flavipsychrobacter sp. JY13-12]